MQTQTSCVAFKNNSDGSGFTCTSYPKDQVSAPDSSGICTIPLAAKPSSSLSFSNPDHGALDGNGSIIPSKGNLNVTHKQLHPQTGEWVTRTIQIHAPQNDNNWSQKFFAGDPGANPTLQAYREVEINRTPVPNGNVFIGHETTREITRDRDSDNNLVVTSDVTSTYAFIKLGEPVKVSETRLTGTGNDLTTTWTYYTDPTKQVSYNKPATMRRSDGQWANFSYEGNPTTGVVTTKTVSGWLDNPAPPIHVTFSGNHVIDDPAAAAAMTPVEAANRVVTVIEAKNETGTFGREEKIQGVIVSKTWGERFKSKTGEIVEKSRVQVGPSVLTTIRKGFPDDKTVSPAERGRIKSIERPDGTVSLYRHTLVGTNRKETVETGTGSLAEVTDGTRVTYTYNSNDVVTGEESFDVSTGMPRDSKDAIAFDANGDPSKFAYNKNTDDTSETKKNCCSVSQETNRDGIVTDYSYDGGKRMTSSTTNGVSDCLKYTSKTIGSTSCPAVEHTKKAGTGNSAIVLNQGTSVYDLAGNTIQDIQPDRNNDGEFEITTTAIDYAARTVTTTSPDGSSSSTVTYADGQIKTTSSTGQADRVSTHTLGADLDGIAGAVHKITATSGSLVTDTYLGVGDVTLATRTNGTITATYGYDSVGRMISSKDADGVTTLYAYNAKGERYRTALDRNSNGEINLGTDTVTDTVTESLANLSGFGPAIRTTRLIWISATETRTLSITLQSPDGTLTRQQTLGVANPATSSNTDHVSRRSGSWTDTQTNPDGTKQVTTYQNWLPITQSMVDNANHVIESVTTGYDILRRPVTRTHSRTGLVTTTYASNGQIASINDHGRVTSFGYDSMGRRILTTLPDNSYAHTSYWPTGQEKATWGSQTNPTVKVYSPLGQLVELRTFRSTSTEVGPDQYTLGYDATTWIYNTRGQLTRKQYADGKGTDYTYTAGGRLLTRTWARGIVTTYGYNASGEPISINYSDDTPDVVITYDSLGRRTSVSSLLSSVAQSSVSYSYDPATLAPVSETVSYDLNTDGTPELTRVIDRSRDNLGRPTGFELKDGTTVEANAIYDYEAATGRLSSVSGNSSGTFTYGYLAHSNLIESVSRAAIGDSPEIKTVNKYEPTRDVLWTKTNGKPNGETMMPVSTISYTVNEIGQRTDATRSGASTTSSKWAYDPLGQLVSSDSSDDLQDRAYLYDNIGNRIRTATGTLTLPGDANYSSNSLNQYIMANGVNLPTTPAPAPYDEDGNLRFDGGVNMDNQPREYRWDAENRLGEVHQGSSGLIVHNYYDAQSRRIAVTTGGNTTSFIYDGFNCIAEYSGTTLSKTRLWGLDLSGSMQGAGGVGGLLAEKQGSNSYYPLFDGNGNITEYVNSTGSVEVHFEYDPFGNTVVNTDSGNRFYYRFSTKPLDFKTGLYYYQYRWYDPLTGRWPSRDPIEENGGMNLYGFVGNDGVNWVDLHGLEWIDLITGSSESDWRLIGSGTRKILHSESGTLLYTRGGNVGNGLATVIYVGSKGPQSAQKASCAEIMFEYRIIGGNNSGFHFSIPDGSDQSGVIKNGFEVQLRIAGIDKKLTDIVSKYDSNRGKLSDAGTRRRNDYSTDRTGSLYQYDEPDVPPNLKEKGWNKINVMLTELSNGQGMDIRISINDEQVNHFNQGDPSHSPVDIGDRNLNPNVPQVGPRSHGLVGFQGHSPSDVTIFRNIKWRTVDEEQNAGK